MPPAQQIPAAGQVGDGITLQQILSVAVHERLKGQTVQFAVGGQVEEIGPFQVLFEGSEELSVENAASLVQFGFQILFGNGADLAWHVFNVGAELLQGLVDGGDRPQVHKGDWLARKKFEQPDGESS